jgi:hypothetical protein
MFVFLFSYGSLSYLMVKDTTGKDITIYGITPTDSRIDNILLETTFDVEDIGIGIDYKPTPKDNAMTVSLQRYAINTCTYMDFVHSFR